MKKIFLSVVLVLFLLVPMLHSQSNSVIDTKQGQLVTMNIPISFAKSTTYYSGEFNLDGYLPFDSTHFFSILWSSDDTVQVTVAMEVRNTIAPGGSSYMSDWTTAVTVITVQANAGNDTLYVRNIFQRGTIPAGVLESETMSGIIGNIGRLVVTFANPTTVGDGGYFRVWAYLPKR